MQIEYSLVERTPERDLLPMAKAFDLAITPYDFLGSDMIHDRLFGGTFEAIDNPRQKMFNASTKG